MNDTAEEIIHRYLSATPGLIADRHRSTEIAARGHERMRLLLTALGDPQLTFQSIHIAGSKGKGTVAHTVDALLRASAVRTGLFTSPHLSRWNERVQLNGTPVDDGAFAGVLSTVERAILAMHRTRRDLGEFNAFELITAAAFILFRDAEIEIGVIETGLGGRFDSTNHLEPAVTVITRIEAEHTDVLGETLREIAWNKTGIMRTGVPCVVVAQPRVALEQILEDATELGLPVLLEQRDWVVTSFRDRSVWQAGLDQITFRAPGLPGRGNLSNIGASLTAISVARDEALSDFRSVRRTLHDIRIPGRFEVLESGGRTVVLDVAHTAESLDQLLRNLESAFPRRPIVMIFSALADKQINAMLTIVAGRIERMILPVQRNPRAFAPKELAQLAHEHGIPATEILSFPDALAEAGQDAIVVVVGSFGLVAAAREYLLNQ